ncbi:MAG: PD-(D/E)XK nuclease family protein [Nanoarchaeota archaeon]|nr:PD-(D/E)XK nuclease family protein [Nanoarchaeota archaeon]
MTQYSHSRLSSFEQCKLKYKYRYIDKIKPTIEKTIEAHLGSCVHDTLEWLYKEILQNNLPTLDALIEKYTNKWQQDYKKNFLIVKKEFKAEDYFNKGIKFLIDYYLKHKPFQDGTLELEKKIFVKLEPNYPHTIIGYIDRLVYNKETEEYEIHDYKTAKNIPPKNKIESDRQLALYSIAIKQLFGEDKKILLTWHYLSHNKRIDSRRTDQQLTQLKQDIINLIKEIESTTEFPPTKSILCNWCEYQEICPVFNKEITDKARFLRKDLTKGNLKGPNFSKQKMPQNSIIKSIHNCAQKTDIRNAPRPQDSEVISNLSSEKKDNFNKEFPTASKYIKN